MNKITLNSKELQEVYDLFNKLNESSEYGSVTLEQEGMNGIGTVLKATFFVTHNEIEGEFTVTITDERDW